jgi:hypothetical protein
MAFLHCHSTHLLPEQTLFLPCCSDQPIMRLVSNVAGRDENNPLLLISNLSHARMCQKEGFRSLVFAI